jgi:hypothetical protein
MSNFYSKLMTKMNNEKVRLEKKAEDSGFEKVEWFKPKTGENMIRLIPNLNDIENSVMIVKVHYLPMVTKDGKEVNVPVRCLQDYAHPQKCPACEKNEELYKAGDKEEAKKYRAKEQYLYTVLDYTGKKIAPYAMPMSAHSTIIGYMDDLGESVFDIENGRDWKLVKKIDPSKGKIYGTEYTIRPSMKESSVPEKFKALIDDQTSLSDLYPESDLAKNKKRMLELMGSSSSVEEDEEEYEEEVVRPAKKAAPSPVKKSAPTPVKKKPVVEEDEDDYGFEEEEEEAPKSKPKAKSKAKVDIDEDLEDELNSLLGEDDE